ncbi:hypothetical protein BGZ73_001139, partial [Actinomortierella ambigua]
MLPTLKVMRERHPDVYKEDWCRACKDIDVEVRETQEHIWDCEATREDQVKIWWEVAGDTVKYGSRMHNLEWGEWVKRRDKAARDEKQFNEREPDFVWRTANDIIDGLSRSIKGITTLFPNDKEEQESSQDTQDNTEHERPEIYKTTTTHDIYHGLVPTNLT